MSEGEQFWKRVEQRMAELRMDLRGLERATRIKYHTLWSSKKRGSMPRSNVADRIALALRTPRQWLETGEGMRTGVISVPAQKLSALLKDMPEERVRLLLDIAESWRTSTQPEPETAPGDAEEVPQK